MSLFLLFLSATVSTRFRFTAGGVLAWRACVSSACTAIFLAKADELRVVPPAADVELDADALPHTLLLDDAVAEASDRVRGIVAIQ